MIFPIWYFDDYSQAAIDLQTRVEIVAAEEIVQDSKVGGPPVAHATTTHIVGNEEDFRTLDETISKGTMPPTGLLMHLVRPTENGFEILDVWDRARDAETFFEERLEPLLQERGLPFTHTRVSEIWDIAPT